MFKKPSPSEKKNVNKGGHLKPNTAYQQIISNLIRKREGNGFGLVPLSKKKVDYVYWNSLDELVDRLVLLKSSRQGGNLAHEQEIASIEEELREENIIE